MLNRTKVEDHVEESYCRGLEFCSLMDHLARMPVFASRFASEWRAEWDDNCPSGTNHPIALPALPFCLATHEQTTYPRFQYRALLPPHYSLFEVSELDPDRSASFSARR